MNINRSKIYTGLFGVVTGTVQNVGLEDVDIYTDSNFTSGIAGSLSGGTIERCSVVGGVDSESTSTGGVVGRSTGKVSNCYFSGAVSGSFTVGGISGEVSSGTVEYCYTNGSITINGDGSSFGENIGGITTLFRNGSTVRYRAAFGSIKSSRPGTNNWGRIAGNVNNGTLSGNVAYSGMKLYDDAVTETPTDKNGEDISKGVVLAGVSYGDRLPHVIWLDDRPGPPVRIVRQDGGNDRVPRFRCTSVHSRRPRKRI